MEEKIPVYNLNLLLNIKCKMCLLPLNTRHTTLYITSHLTYHTYTVYLPCEAVFAVSLSSINNGVFVVAVTPLTLHTLPYLVHVGSLGTATAIHWREADLARVVSLTEGLAGTTAGGHVVAIHCSCFTRCTEFA